MRHQIAIIFVTMLGPAWAAQAGQGVPNIISIEAENDENIQNGCPAGSFDYATSPDNQVLQMRFFNYDLEAVNGARSEKRCELIAAFNVPAGYSVGIESITVRGRADALTRGDRGQLMNSYRPIDAPWPVTAVMQSFNGPVATNFTVPGRVSRDRMLFTPCSTMNTEQRVMLSSSLLAEAAFQGRAAIGSDQFQRGMTHEYRFIWTRCANPTPPGNDWFGSCRVVLESIWGQDVREFWRDGIARTEQAAIRAAEEAAHYACERDRAGSNIHRCTTDRNRCYATPTYP